MSLQGISQYRRRIPPCGKQPHIHSVPCNSLALDKQLHRTAGIYLFPEAQTGIDCKAAHGNTGTKKQQFEISIIFVFYSNQVIGSLIQEILVTPLEMPTVVVGELYVKYPIYQYLKN